MAAIGVLKTEYDPTTPENDGWVFSKTNIRECHARLANEVHHPPKGVIDLSTAAALLTVIGLNEAAIFKRMLDGQLSAYCHHLYPYALNELLFVKADIEAWVNQMKVAHQRQGQISISVS
jgi:hypothetical protein